MMAFLARRLARFALTLLCVVATTFLLMRSVRGGPLHAERSLPPAIADVMRQRYHLDWPLWKQFLQYLGPLNLDQEGLVWLSARAADRKWTQVRGQHGDSAWEAEPRELAHLVGVNEETAAQLEDLLVRSLAQAEPSAVELEQWRALAPKPMLQPGRDLRLPPLLSELARAVSQSPLAEQRAQRVVGLLSLLTGYSAPASADESGLSRTSLLARRWFGWYYRHGGDHIWHSGERPFGGLLALDLGPSYRYRDYDVASILSQSLPISAALGAWALVLALLCGIPAGVCAALRRDSLFDRGLRLASTIAAALPNFVLASLLLLVGAFFVPLFPVGGFGSARQMVLPALSLATPHAAYLARLTRTGMLECLAEPYILAARAKGLSRTRIVLLHCLPQALLPVLSYLGPAIAGILSGSLVIERIFFLPGTGSHFVNGALNRDYTLAMALTIFYTLLVFALNTLVDVIYTLIDPRIKLSEA